MYRLYWDKLCGAIAPQAIFEEAGVPYEKIVIDLEKDEHRSASFLAVNPMGQLPVLELPDGSVMTESAAIVLHLLDRHPEAALAPPSGTPEHARFLRWLVFMAATHYDACLRAYYPDHFSSEPAAHESIRARAFADLDRCWGILEAELEPGPYLLGEGFSAADIYLWMLGDWHPEAAAMRARHPRIDRLMKLVQARPAIARTWADNGGD